MSELKQVVREIIRYTALALKQNIDEKLELDIVDIFPNSEVEREALQKELDGLGREVSRTKTGPFFRLREPIETELGPLEIVRVRIYDPTRPQRGAPDFRVKDFSAFKQKYLARKGFKLIGRKDYDMIELDANDKVLIYFLSTPFSESIK